jgi:hypothetical protein
LTRHELLQALKILINVRSRRNDPRANGAEKNRIDCEELHNALRVGCIKRCLQLLDDLECLLFRTGERRQRRRYHYRAGQEEFAHGFAPAHCFTAKIFGEIRAPNNTMDKYATSAYATLASSFRLFSAAMC